MRMTVLASGSKGNSTVIASERTRVLVDAGLSCRELLRRMAIAGEDPEKLSAILITHEHHDHIDGLAVLARRLRIPVFFTEPTHRAWVRMLTPRTTMTYAKWLSHLQQQKEARAAATTAAIHPYDLDPSATGAAEFEAVANISAEAATLDPEVSHSTSPAAQAEDEEPCDEEATASLPAAVRADPTFLPSVEYFRPGVPFCIGDLSVSPFTTPHDAADPCGFVFESAGIRMAIATDLGYMPPNVKAALKRIDVLLLESNHDLEMLRDGPYPWSVKQRVLSRVGHLSNEATAEWLARDYDGGAAYIILGHISASNNDPALALLAAEQAIGDRMTLLGNRVLTADQSEPMSPISL
jgi:phosphoribosyl 1,2-cyclic phosphodiesterase